MASSAMPNWLIKLILDKGVPFNEGQIYPQTLSLCHFISFLCNSYRTFQLHIKIIPGGPAPSSHLKLHDWFYNPFHHFYNGQLCYLYKNLISIAVN